MGIFVDPGKLNALGTALSNKTADFNNELLEVEKENNFLMSSWKSDSGRQYSKEVDDQAKLLKDLVVRLNKESEGLKRSSNNYSKAEHSIGENISRSPW